MSKLKKQAGTCPICGAAVKPRNTYCSRSCAGKAAVKKSAPIDMDYAWVKVGDGIYRCRYQKNVQCSDRNCAKCGWNPVVAKRRTQKAAYIADREMGMTLREIADKYGVSITSVHNCLGKQSVPNFHPFGDEKCVYPNLRNWLNEHQVTLQEFTLRLCDNGYNGNSSAVGTWLRGKTYPNKESIDKILRVTGLTYEQLFAEEV